MSKTLAFVVAALGGLGATALADPDLPTQPPADPVDPIHGTEPPPNAPADAPAPILEPVAPAPPPVDPAPVVQPTVIEPTVSQPTMVEEDMSVYAWREPRMQSGIGVGFTVGGGVTGFTDKTMRDTVSTDVGGLWDARLSLGTHVPIGLDLSYVGSAANVHSFAGTPNGTLVGTTAEAALRWNILPHELVTPYLFGGAGWQRYNLRNIQLATSDSGMQAHDNVLEIPMGAGLAVRSLNGFTLDARGTFRAQATDSNLVLDSSTGTYAKLHTWEASANLGYEF